MSSHELSFELGGRSIYRARRILGEAQEKRAMKTVRLQLSPLIVAIGGTTRPNSSTECALRLALKEVAREGARVMLLGGPDLDIPLYGPSDWNDRKKRSVLLPRSS